MVARPPGARWIAVSLALPFVLGTCTEGGTGPGHHRAALAVTTTLPSSAELAAFNLYIDNVRLIVVRPPSDTLFDQVVPFPANQTSLPLTATVELQQDQEALEVTIQLLSGTQVLYSGTQSVVVTGDLDPAPTPIPVTYGGPGQTVATLTIGPQDSVLSFGGGVTFRLTARDAQNNLVPDFYASWTTSDTTVAQVDATGHLTAPPVRGTLNILARTPTNVTTSTAITFAPVATAITIVSGCGQSGAPGAQLPQPIVVRVIAADQIGVEGVAVQFTPPAGGAVATPSTVTDANGLAQTLVTLPLSGSAGFSIGAAGLGTVACNQTILGATQLVFTTEPPASFVAGTPFPVSVRAADAQGVTVPSFTGVVSLTVGSNPGGISFTSNVTAVAGVATFVGLTITKAAAGYTLVASSGGLAPATTNPFDVIAGVPAQLAFAVGPPPTVAAMPIAPPLQVAVQDAFGNFVPTASKTVTMSFGSNPGSATLGGTLVQATVAGVATFGDLTINKSGTGFTLLASSPGLSNVLSGAFNVLPSETALVFTTQPTNTIAGSVIAPPVVVTVLDAFANPDASFTGAITVAIGTNPSNGVLGGTLTVNAVAGVATFSDLSIDKPGTGYTLVANAPALPGATSAPFNVSAGNVAQLVCASQPNITAGTPFTPVVVIARDGQGNTATGFVGNVSLAFGTHPIGTTLGGTTTVAAAAGVATFSNLANPTVAGGYTLVASSAGLQSVVCGSFTVDPGPPTQLAFKAQPSTVSVGAVIAPIVQVAIEDAFGNTVTPATDNVTLAIGTNPGNATLGGTPTKAAASGVALFTDLTLNQVGVGYTLIASSGILAPATSSAFDVTSGAVTHLAVVVTPPTVTAGVPAAITVTAQDGSNNTVAAYRGTVHFTSTDPQAVLPADYTFTAGDNGVHAFPVGATLKTAGSQSVTATDIALPAITGSQSVSVTPGTAAALFFTVQPNATVLGAALTPPVQVTARDAFGNTATGFVGSVLVLIGNNPGSASLSGTLSQTAIAGVATFAGLSLDRAGVGYTLTAAATGLTGATSTTFDISALSSGVAWNNPLGGNWNVAGNWSPARVPGKADTVFITLSGTYTVTLDVNDTVAFLTIGGATGAQTLNATGRTFGIDTAASILANGVLNLTGTTINGDGTLSNVGSLFVTPGSSVIHAAVGNGVGGLLRLNGNNGFADLGVIGGLTNSGTVELMGTSWGGRLTVTGGNFQNAPTGTLHSAASAGNAYTGVLDNQGAVLVDGPLSLNGVSTDHQSSGTITLGAGNLTLTQSGTTPSFTTSGSIVVGSGRTFQVNGGAFNYVNASPGGLAGLGTMNLNSVTLGLTPDFTQDTLSLVLASSIVNGTGILHVAATRTLTLTGTTLNVPLDNAGTVQATFGTNVLNGAVANQNGALLRLNGNNGFADVTVATGFTNAGTIQLTGTSWAGRLTVGGVLVNGVTGTLHSAASAGNVFTGVLNNQGAVLVDGPLTLNAASANHVNSGTITLGLGNLTLSQSGTTPSFTTTGSVVVGSGRTLQVSGGAFNYSNASPGGLAGLGTVSFSSVTLGLTPGFTQDTLSLVLTSSIVNGPGILHVATARTLTLTGSTLNVALDNQGTVQATPGTNLLNGVVTNANGALLRLNGNNGFADVTVASGFTNAGTIELTGTSWAGRLTVASGLLINGPTGTLQSGVGAGNVLTAPLDNQGAVLVDGPLTLNAASADHLNSGTITLGAGNLTVNQSGTTPSFTTSGDVVVGAGRTWTVNSGVVNHTAGKIEGNGTLAFNGVTLGLGVSLVHDTLQVALNTVTVNGPGTLTVASGATMTLTNCTINTAFINQGTVQAVPGVNTFNAALTNPAGALLRLNGNNGFADVTVASAFTNGGIIELTGTSWAGRLTVGSPTLATLVNASGATLRTVAGAGNVLTAQLNNQGTVLVNGLLTLNGLSADHQNSGTISLGSGDLTLSQTGTTPSFTTTGSMIVGSGRVLQVNGGAFNYANTIPGGLAGLGTVNFSGATLNLTPNFSQDTLTLVPTSTIINGPGTLTVIVGRTLTLTGSTVNTTLNNFGAVQATPGTNLLSGPFSNQAGAMLRLNGNNGFADVTVANGFTNDGTIELTGTSWAGRLTVTTGTLVNGLTGTLQTIAGAGNVYNGDFDNQGQVLVGGPLTMNGGGNTYSNSGQIRLVGADMNVLFSSGRPGMSNTGLIDVGTKTFKVSGPSSDFLNQGSGVMRGSGTFDLSGTSFITNAAVTVGNAGGPISAGKLNIIGPYLQGPSPSVLNVKIGGDPLKPGVDYDQLSITGGGAELQQGSILNVTVGATQPGSYVVIQLPVGQTFNGNFAQINFSANCDLFSGPSGNQYLLTCQ